VVAESVTLGEAVDAFSADLASFPGFDPLHFRVGDLQKSSDWPWGYRHGVYCFVRDGIVVYVGRALGSTLGQRLWDQLRSVSDPAWAEVVNDPDCRVEVFAVDKDRAYLGAALEAYLIDRLKPAFNSRAA
jgi:hypothetical protein